MAIKLQISTLSLFLITCISFTVTSNAQSGSIFYHLTPEQELASNRCNSILQDSEGYYWIATDDGLSRFDGSHCKNFRKNARDSSSLSSNLCYNLLEDKQGNIWIGTYQGINRYNKKTATFTRYYLSNSKISSGYNNIVRSLTMDNEGNIWVAAGGLWCFDVLMKKWTLFENDLKDIHSVPSGIITQVAFDKRLNGIWILTGQRFALYDIRQRKFFSSREPAPQWNLLKDSGIINFTIEEGRGIWFSTYQNNGGLFFYDFSLNTIDKKLLLYGRGLRKMSITNTGKLWLHFYSRATEILDTKINSVDSLFLLHVHDQSPSSDASNDLFIDKAGYYWIASGKGVNIYNPDFQKITITSLLHDNKLNNEQFEIRDIVQKDTGGYFVATTNGIYAYEPSQSFSIRKLPFAGNQPTDKMYLSGKNELWFSTKNKIYSYDLFNNRVKEIYTTKSKVQSIIAAQNGLVYVATWTKGLFVFDQNGNLQQQIIGGIGGKLQDNWIICALLSRDKKYIWIGYNGGKGFSKYCIEDGSIKDYYIKVSLPESRAANTINYITENKDSSVWLSTYGGGLFLYNISNNSFRSYNSKNGLESDFVFQTEPDLHGNLWISTPKDIYYKAAGSENIIKTEIQLPELNNDVLQNIFSGPENNYIFFRKDKIVRVQADNFFRNEYPFKILITAASAGQKEIIINNLTENKIEANYDDNDISIEFSLLRPNTDAIPVYSYKLEGVDKDWINAANRNFVQYANLVPDKYVFRAKAIDPRTGKEFLSSKIYIKILPPWWQTTWFRLILLAILITFLFAAIRTYIRSKLLFQKQELQKQLAIQSERERITADLHDDVGATLSSLHIFGDLASTVWDTQPQQSKDMVGKISLQSKELMERMSDIVWSLKTPGEEKNSLLLKLKNYSQDLLSGKSIGVHFEIDETLDLKMTDPLVRKNILLIAKEAINNIAKYSSATDTFISFKQKEDQVLFSIRDNGNGFDMSLMKNGNGLGNIEQRCKQLNGSFLITTDPGHGVTITCIFPIAIISHAG